MATLVAILWACALAATALVGWFLTLVGMPGNWLIVGATAIYAALRPEGAPLGVTWPTVGVLAGLALAGEIVETAAGAAGVSRVGGSRRSALLALVGSIVGGMTGLFVGLPAPIIGPLLGAVLCAGLGALVGAMLGETWKGRSLDQSARVGAAAFWGRLLGTLAKTLIGAVMVAVTLAALIV